MEREDGFFVFLWGLWQCFVRKRILPSGFYLTLLDLNIDSRGTQVYPIFDKRVVCIFIRDCIY